MLAFKSVFIFFIMFLVSVYLYANVVKYLVNKHYTSLSDDEVCRLTQKYHRLKECSVPIESYSFALDVKDVLRNLNEKKVQGYLMFEKSSAIMYLIFTLLILLINSFGNDQYFVIYISIGLMASIIIEMLSTQHKVIYDLNCLQIIQYVKDIYGDDINDIMNDSTMVYQ